MSTTMGRVFTGVTRLGFIQRIFIHNSTASVRSNGVRSLAVTSQMAASSKGEEEVNDEPIKFSTSKASHRTWKVKRTLGSDQARPLWRVIPFSLFGVAFIIWCTLRNETDVDSKLDKQLHEHFPSMPSDEEQIEEENKPT